MATGTEWVSVKRPAGNGIEYQMHDLNTSETLKRIFLPHLSSGFTKTDREIALRLAKRFEQDLDDAGLEGLAFYVRDGHVTICGRIPSKADERILTVLILALDGVLSVECKETPSAPYDSMSFTTAR